MTVKLGEWSRDHAEALYDAAIFKMIQTEERGHLYGAAVQLRLDCGMHGTVTASELVKQSGDAINKVNEAIGESNPADGIWGG